eukprot:TRINITY_DN60679_c0_g1_i1.p2 TRINITY_DN60679_c0_g1~~TRINITY_DN60679_c0_g1_i1.p2  ORF type:complete len:193 (-),score=58.61 TRINITY_DN60679_c0_g1_i1:47-625(-)
MKVLALFLVLAISSTQGQGPHFTCEECIDEMHKLGLYVKLYGETITKFLVEDFCPTTEDEDCAHHVADHYVDMINAVINHFVIDGATHICQLMGICGVKSERAYTCEECIAGLDFVAEYLLDDMEIREFTVYLEQFYCNPDQDRCPGQIVNYFPTMHRMAMEKFFIPSDICHKEPVCGATRPTHQPPTKPGF